ncbi:hypothetical protein AX16_008875 [Volvariella volvacea WC 439]|nr:hypothetical protein AX16_008875 [Volvariella volvacea WC 439]
MPFRFLPWISTRWSLRLPFSHLLPQQQQLHVISFPSIPHPPSPSPSPTERHTQQPMSSHHHLPLARLLSSNVQWAKDVQQVEPTFFAESAKGQTPHTLWIGCADSRVPESVVTGARPGEIFVHRNIANQFHPDDENVLSVLKYAVDFLGVEHVVIVGHTNCGGAMACLNAARAQNNPNGTNATITTLPPDEPLNRWLAPLTDLAVALKVSSAPPDDALQLVVEENVKKQVENLAKSQTIVNAWANKSGQGKEVWIHGWVYDLGTGKLKDLGVSRGPPSRQK